MCAGNDGVPSTPERGWCQTVTIGRTTFVDEYEVEKLQQKVAQLEKCNDQQARRISSHQNTVTQLAARSERLAQQLNEMYELGDIQDETINALRCELQAVPSGLHRCYKEELQRTEELTAKVAELQKRNDTQKRSIENLGRQVADWRRRWQDGNYVTAEACVDALKFSKDEVAKLNRLLDRSVNRDVHDRIVADLKRSNARLRAVNRDLRDRFARLYQIIKALSPVFMAGKQIASEIEDIFDEDLPFKKRPAFSQVRMDDGTAFYAEGGA